MQEFSGECVPARAPRQGHAGSAPGAPACWIPLIAVLALGLIGAGSPEAGDAATAALPDGKEIARRINARDDGATFFGAIRMEVVDPRGVTRVREIRTLRRESDGARKTLFVFDAPKDLRGTGLLIHDHRDASREDDQWLYLPAARNVRRIASSDRGAAFVGTDFSYDDMKNGSKVSLNDYRFTTLRRERVGDADCYVVRAEPASPEVAEELGYGSVLYWIDVAIWMARRAEFSDLYGRPLKTITARGLRQVDGIWTAHTLEAVNHQTGHETILSLERVRYGFDLSDDALTTRTLERGLLREP